jgi:hypothetical protein
MDLFPYKRGTTLRVYREREEGIANIQRAYQEEMTRLAANNAKVMIPEMTIESPSGVKSFEDVEVTAHDTRIDLFKPGVVTALDVLLTLEDRGELSNVRLTWYNRIGSADPVETYFVDQIDDTVSSGGCGFVYEVGPRAFSGFRGNHIHLPADTRIIMAPEYGHWFWICL